MLTYSKGYMVNHQSLTLLNLENNIYYFCSLVVLEIKFSTVKHNWSIYQRQMEEKMIANI